MTNQEAKSCIGTIEMLQRLAYNIHGVMDVIDADNCKKIIKALEQEPKTGHWIESNIPNEEYVCSECGGASWYYDCQGDVAKSNFCPNCGAKMEEGSEE